ncbi:MAG: hypothetical protein IPK82_09545 [Polyangiaceae bacterium]|nr:hypothetical protein [Polyangiaceae bacterium]
MAADRSLTRRGFLASAFAAAAMCTLETRDAFALGRTPTGGKVSFRVPWQLSSIDPHDVRDPAAALFSQAIFDTLFAIDGAQMPYPTLANSLPTREGAGTVLRIREGLRTARGTALDARDVIFSIERAIARGGLPLWADLPKPAAHPAERLAVVFGTADPVKLAKSLSSPLFALVPKSFNSQKPDGTGAFRAELKPSKLTLSRNPNAARGGSFLDSIEVESAPDLKASLRQFEAERDDVGWLGLGLFGGRKGSRKFDLGTLGYVVLMIGTEAGSAGGIGAAQTLANAFGAERIGHLGLGTLPAGAGSPAWTGPKTDLLVDETATHLVEVASTLAPLLSNPGHEVSVLTVARSEIQKRRGKAALMLDLARPLLPGPLGTFVSLANAYDPVKAQELYRKPPKNLASSARQLAAGLEVGVIGEVRAQGGVIAEVNLTKNAVMDSWDLGASYRRKPGK